MCFAIANDLFVYHGGGLLSMWYSVEFWWLMMPGGWRAGIDHICSWAWIKKRREQNK
jgi:hypothetical protein